MKTPIYNYLNNFVKEDVSRLFMPGHKGNLSESNPLHDIAKYDITEITGADSLFEAEGIIAQSEQIASDYFGSKATLFSTQGSTLGIQTMLKLVAKKDNTKIIAGRNAHMAFINACSLLRINPVWVLPEVSDRYGVCGKITAAQIEGKLTENPDAKAVYITSPDYLGNTADVEQIALVCQKYGVELLCDNAHGAYLKATNTHPLDLGVTMCCDSAHKTLPALTGAGYLHLSKTSKYTKDEAKACMNIFASTSPSYLIMMSLDLCNDYLHNKAEKEFLELKSKVHSFKENLTQKGVVFCENNVDFAKVTIDANKMGYTGTEIKKYLTENDVECEYANDNYIVFMLTPFNKDEDFDRLERLLTALEIKSKIKPELSPYSLPQKKLTPYEAMSMPCKILSIDDANGRISAQTVSKCPPGVPVVVAGEIINEKIKKVLKNCGNFSIKVV